MRSGRALPGLATLFNLAAAPMIGATHRLQNELAFGAAFYGPFGGASVWKKNEGFVGNETFAGPENGVQRWNTIDGSLRSMFATVGVGYRIEAARLSIGLTGNLVLSSMDTVRARDADGSNRLSTEGRSHLAPSGVTGSFGLEAMFEAIPSKPWIGASYPSLPGVTGGITMKGNLRNELGPGTATDLEVSVYQNLPDIVRFSLEVRPHDGVELRIFGDVSRWRALQDQCLSPPGEECKVEKANGAPAEGTKPVQNIPRRWNDTFGLRLGASLFPRENLEVMVGAGYDGNAIPDSTLDPSTTDFQDVSFALGGKLRITKQLAAAVTNTHFMYIPRDTAGRDESASTYVAPPTAPTRAATPRSRSASSTPTSSSPSDQAPSGVWPGREPHAGQTAILSHCAEAGVATMGRVPSEQASGAAGTWHAA
jgi:long-chain fatty acid transport protein